MKTLKEKIGCFVPYLICFPFIFLTLITFQTENGFTKLDNNFMQSFCPQGWAFFTRNPREPQVLMYKGTSIHTKKLLSKNPFTLDRFLGLSRVSRRKSLEFGGIYFKIRKKNWIENTVTAKISDSLIVCIENSETKLNPGRYFLIKKDVVPWAWASNIPEGKSTIAKLVVK